ncbi:MAG: NADPH cytochrome P450 oxidoreductase family protein, partial [Bacteroidota bacterium]
EPPMQALDIEASSVDTRFPVYAFEVFQNMKLGALKKIEFPFSEDDLDPYTVELRDEKLVIHQYTGQVLEAYQSSWISIVSYWSYRLHTGSESIIWSLILGVSTTGVLFLIFSGFSIAYKRFRVKVPQSDAPEEAEYVLLYGSENGSTKAFALALYQALKANQQKVYVNELNKYTQLPNLKRLIILTSTYGEGVAPDNGDQFLEQFRQNPPAQPFDFAVLGFGSLAYPKFCQFAKDVHQELTTVPNAQQLLDVKLIHNQAKQEFFDWTKQLGSSLGLSLTIAQFFKVKKPKLDQFILIDRKIVKVDDQQTYLIALKPDKSHDFQSGDLLNFYPEKDPVKRSYSISKNLSGFILLAIKRHEQGMVSNYLFNLPLGEKVEAQIEHNIHFHFPAEPKSVVLIGNGTGMGPFVGMIEHNKSQSIELYWGGRSSKSFALYRPFIDEALERGRLSKCEIAYSREGEERTYVQTLIRKDGEVLAKKLEQGSHLMICGSIDMQNDVLEVLDTVTKQYLSRPIDYYIEKEQVKMDCY